MPTQRNGSSLAHDLAHKIRADLYLLFLQVCDLKAAMRKQIDEMNYNENGIGNYCVKGERST